MVSLLSRRSAFAENPIEEEDRVADELAEERRKVLKLNRGDPAAYFRTPRYILDAYVEAIREGKTGYSDPRGVRELREAVAKRYERRYGLKTDFKHVIMTQGVSEAIALANAALIDKGDRAVLFRPSYPLYRPYLRLYGGVEVDGRYEESSGWGVDVDSLARTLAKLRGRKPKYLLVTNPNNPTGTVLGRNVLRELVDLSNEHGILLISDERYAELVFTGARFTSVCELARGMPYVILNGASKGFDATGFRIGFFLIPGDDRASVAVREKLADFAMLRLSPNTPAQYAFAAGLNNVAEHKRAMGAMLRQIASRVNFATKLVNESRYLETVRPSGAFYLFPKVDWSAIRIRTDREFVDRLLKEEYVQLTRGSGFGCAGHIRIVALPTKDILESAIDKINKFCRKHKR